MFWKSTLNLDDMVQRVLYKGVEHGTGSSTCLTCYATDVHMIGIIVIIADSSPSVAIPSDRSKYQGTKLQS